MQELKKKKETIYHKSIQVLAMLITLTLTARTTRAVKETFLKLEKAAQQMSYSQ
jgi:hypothetical protein